MFNRVAMKDEVTAGAGDRRELKKDQNIQDALGRVRTPLGKAVQEKERMRVTL